MYIFQSAIAHQRVRKWPQCLLFTSKQERFYPVLSHLIPSVDVKHLIALHGFEWQHKSLKLKTIYSTNYNFQPSAWINILCGDFRDGDWWFRRHHPREVNLNNRILWTCGAVIKTTFGPTMV